MKPALPRRGRGGGRDTGGRLAPDFGTAAKSEKKHVFDGPKGALPLLISSIWGPALQNVGVRKRQMPACFLLPEEVATGCEFRQELERSQLLFITSRCLLLNVQLVSTGVKLGLPKARRLPTARTWLPLSPQQ